MDANHSLSATFTSQPPQHWNPTQLWNTTWGGTNQDYGEGLAVAGDGVYVAGYTSSFGAGGYDALLVKYASNGTQLWNTTWGGASNDYGYAVANASDGVYIVGTRYGFAPNYFELLLAKYDSSGNLLWDTSWGGTGYEYAFGVAVASDGIYVTGKTNSFGGGSMDAFLVKFDSIGNQLWNTTWGGTEYDYGRGLAVGSDGVYITGYTYSFGAGNYDALLVKYGSNGTQLWNTTWGGTNHDFGYDMAVASDGVYVAGYTRSFGAGNYDAFLVKFDSSGNYVGNTTWGGAASDMGRAMAIASDGVYITGSTQSFGQGMEDVFLVKYSQQSSEPTGDQTYTLELTIGWNMVSLPIIPDNPLASSILSDVEYYQLATWSGTGYVTATEFEAGRGYWLLVLEDVNVTLSGTSIETLNITLSLGWSMIGGTNDEVQAVGVFPDFYQLVTWTGTGYTPASTFEPGKGYWALVLETTEIELPPG